MGPEDADPLNNTALLLNCSARGEPPPTITWIRGDVPIISDLGGRVQVMANGSLYFREVMLLDTGTYICNASNSLGSTEADSVMVMVQSTWLRHVVLFCSVDRRFTSCYVAWQVIAFLRGCLMVGVATL